MIPLNIIPYVGMLPIEFGQSRSDILQTLGSPGVAGNASDSWGPRLEIAIGYDETGLVNHIGVGPGVTQLSFMEQPIWLPGERLDPNPLLLQFDPGPLSCVGFLVFLRLGVATAGFHDDDPAQQAIVSFARGTWDRVLARATRADMSKYKD